MWDVPCVLVVMSFTYKSSVHMGLHGLIRLKDGLLIGPAGHRSRGPKGQGPPGLHTLNDPETDKDQNETQNDHREKNNNQKETQENCK